MWLSGNNVHQLALRVTLQAQPKQRQEPDVLARQWAAVDGLLAECHLKRRQLRQMPRTFLLEGVDSQRWFWGQLEAEDSQSAQQTALDIGRTVAGSLWVAQVELVLDQKQCLSSPRAGKCQLQQRACAKQPAISFCADWTSLQARSPAPPAC